MVWCRYLFRVGGHVPTRGWTVCLSQAGLFSVLGISLRLDPFQRHPDGLNCCCYRGADDVFGLLHTHESGHDEGGFHCVNHGIDDLELHRRSNERKHTESYNGH